MEQGDWFFKREIYYNVTRKSLLLAFKELISILSQRNELNLTGYTISAFLCTDTATSYKKFAAMKGIKHEAINARNIEYVRQKIYHIQNVNSYHRRLKDWMSRFNGVATKYLNGYLVWRRFLRTK